MNCIIIEDQQPAQRILKKYIDDTNSLNLIGTYTDALETLEMINSQKVDLIFLDIHLPKLSGIDFLKTLTHPPKVILTTAFDNYAIESYELNVVDYLLKPFSFPRFLKAITKATDQNIQLAKTDQNSLAEKNTTTIFIKSGYEHIRIDIEDIYFIKSDSDYLEIHLKDKKHLSSDSLSSWDEFLTPKDYVRIHKSYIINTKKIEKIAGNQVYLKDNKIIPIGRAYKANFFKQYLT
ncbi:MAG: LytR/AlgR family response regulator transcription factor [Winogradskyella sp.]|uniref:LytR/AlgR family response regulator transcription factor n=1 Tax=Winogradskyella sp. TaxID=1883156 RepID=UPI00385FE011